MKRIALTLLVMATLVSSGLYAQEKTETVKVYGECGMCKKRIEKAAMAAGATTAVWNEETKMLSFTVPAGVAPRSIEKKIAAAGHDTKNETADDAVYNKLPGCCKYDRKGKGGEDHKDHKH